MRATPSQTFKKITAALKKKGSVVVWATELFRLMLVGKLFLLETNHLALRNLLKDKTTKEKLARWALKLQQFKMLVLTQKGKDQGMQILCLDSNNQNQEPWL